MAVNAATDALAQGPDARCLLIGNGASDEDRRIVEKFCLDNERALAWFHEPPLPSLAATWNRGLEFVWALGERQALVANHDTRYTSDTFSTLLEIMQQEQALLVTATGVEEEETLFKEAQEFGQAVLAFESCNCIGLGLDMVACQRCGGTGKGKVRRGGPGFSLFLISRECHDKYKFDENLIPAFGEDCAIHREMMLRGDGDRIFGSNVRYLHLGGQTLKRMSPERRAAHEAMISAGTRTHYLKKWGGPVNEEQWIIPFNHDDFEAWDPRETPQWIYDRVARGESVTNPALFEEIRKGWK